jgi:RNA polymerase sigma factor (sigma-70 family)
MAGAPPSVTALVDAAAAGEQDAWAEIVDRYLPLVWSIVRAHRLEHAAAEDVNQTVWLRLVEHLGRLREPEALPGWLASTTRHECLRVGKRQLETSLTWEALEALPDEHATDEPVLADERSRIVGAELARLSEKCRALLRVFAYSPDTAYADISEALGMPVGSIGPTRSRCLDRLRTRLESVGYLAARG